jgi:phenylacetate-coenzyme A ligase PaaK-like adenylate-forming protein
MNINELETEIFDIEDNQFEEKALAIFRFQAAYLPIYKQYIELLKIDLSKVNSIHQIPFLPISFFKSTEIYIQKKGAHPLPVLVFNSSGTTGQIPSKHYVVDPEIYETSFLKIFQQFFGDVDQYCILGLLPSYLERGNSSLVYMVNQLIKKSEHASSDFYLDNQEKLYQVILELEKKQQPTLLFGVTYALIDFAEKYPMPLNYVKIIETGGMKGRREELTRKEVHALLKNAFSIPHIFSEYGMTELLSQAYSLQNGIYEAPNWLRVLVRELSDPLTIKSIGKGAINIIDLANLYSCSFIATDDYGEVFENHSFEINGRIEQSEIRGCSLLTV